MALGNDSRLMKLFIETYMQNEDRQGGQQLMNSRAQNFMVNWISTIVC
jgi:hypothetical protein